MNDDSGQGPKLIAHFAKAPRSGPPLELSAPPANPGEDRAPRVELSPKLIARLDDAA